MPGIDGEGHQHGRERRKRPGQQADRDKLHAARVDKDAHEQGPENSVACLLQQHAEGSAQKQIAGHHWQSAGEGSPQCVRLHEKLLIKQRLKDDGNAVYFAAKPRQSQNVSIIRLKPIGRKGISCARGAEPL